MLTLTMHQKDDIGWWRPVRTAPIDSPVWDSFDRSFLSWMQDNDSEVVTIGHTMYHLSTADEA